MDELRAIIMGAPLAFYVMLFVFCAAALVVSVAFAVYDLFIAPRSGRTSWPGPR